MILQNFKDKEEVIAEFDKIKDMTYRGVDSLEHLTSEERNILGENLIEMPRRYLRLATVDDEIGKRTCSETATYFLRRLQKDNELHRHGAILAYKDIPFAFAKGYICTNILPIRSYYQRLDQDDIWPIQPSKMFKPGSDINKPKDYIFPLIKGIAYSVDHNHFSDSEELIWNFIKQKKDGWARLEVTDLKYPIAIMPSRVIARHDFFDEHEFSTLERCLYEESMNLNLDKEQEKKEQCKDYCQNSLLSTVS